MTNVPDDNDGLPNLPDPVKQLNEYDRALKSLAEEEKHLREELGTKDPLEETDDTLQFATQLLLVIRAISKIKQERGAVLRRLTGSFGTL
jgi:cell shape-determining protein MreC